MGHRDYRHFAHTKFAGSKKPAVPGDYVAVTIHQDRCAPAKLDDAAGNLGDLRIRVLPGVLGVGDERLHLAVFDVEHVVSGDSKMKRPASWRAVEGSGANLQTLQTSVCSLTVAKPRAVPSRMAYWPGRTH